MYYKLSLKLDENAGLYYKLSLDKNPAQRAGQT